MDVWEYERAYIEAGFNRVAGADEAGRGPLAGAVFAAAVILPFGLSIKGLDDSKKVSPKMRELLFDEICEKAVCFAICQRDERQIDTVNILNASLQAMGEAVETLQPAAEAALIDGNKAPKLLIPVKAVIKGDSLSASISAASILAKVSRDRYMLEMAEKYPEYEFEKHKGYPTKAHIEAVKRFGPCPIHRKTFLTKIYPGI